MTSTISTSGINASFPVAGVDNDSQGFRTNFQSIKTQLETAATEITDLQSFTAKNNDDNDFTGNVLEDFVALQEKYQTYNLGVSVGTGATVVDWQNGSYQTATTSSANGTRTFSFANFGTAGSAARLTLDVNLVATGANNKIQFSSAVKYPDEYISGGPEEGDANLGEGRHVYEFVTTDVGVTISLMNYKFFPA